MRIDYASVTASYWDAESKNYFDSHPEHLDRKLHPSWGLWHIPESSLGLLSGSIHPGCQVVDLGCGIGHDAVGFADLGANVIAIDISQEQLKLALNHPLVQYSLAEASNLPISNNSIDIAISDHGAFDHSPASPILAEVYRILKPGGLLVVCTYSPIAIACYDPQTERIGSQLLNTYPSGQMRFDGKLVTSEMSYADWIQAFTAFDFVVERLAELRPDLKKNAYFGELVDLDWAMRWPTDIAWVVKKGTRGI